MLTASYAHAQRSSVLSADFPDARTEATQKKVDKLFDSGEFERSFFIYRKELAPLGDKYAQYMVGFMFATGMGTEKDVVQASAWYRLASERDTPEFVAVKERLLRSMTEEQLDQSDLLYYKLRREYSDLVVLLQSIKRDVRELEARTGSRLRSETSPVSVINARSGRVRSGADYYGHIERQLEDRLHLIVEIGGFEDVSTDPKRANVHQLETLVRELIERNAD